MATTQTISTQGHFGPVTDRIAAIATQGHFLGILVAGALATVTLLSATVSQPAITASIPQPGVTTTVSQPTITVDEKNDIS